MKIGKALGAYLALECRQLLRLQHLDKTQPLDARVAFVQSQAFGIGAPIRTADVFAGVEQAGGTEQDALLLFHAFDDGPAQLFGEQFELAGGRLGLALAQVVPGQQRRPQGQRQYGPGQQVDATEQRREQGAGGSHDCAPARGSLSQKVLP